MYCPICHLYKSVSILSLPKSRSGTSIELIVFRAVVLVQCAILFIQVLGWLWSSQSKLCSTHTNFIRQNRTVLYMNTDTSGEILGGKSMHTQTLSPGTNPIPQHKPYPLAQTLPPGTNPIPWHKPYPPAQKFQWFLAYLPGLHYMVYNCTVQLALAG